MSGTRTADQVLEEHYLKVRAMILDLASALDRIERADGGGQIGSDARLKQIHDAIAIVQNATLDRAEQVQMLFSDAYDPDWDKQ